ncbi:MAG: hypothetical protein L6Q97_20240 [Thermoanaerobaculia bacterium]|nr:hypothetical protein [Thermoanaerobaculia bacterium]
MTDSLLFRTLSQLSARERHALCSFTRCPCFNRREEVSRLCDYLVEHIGKPGRKVFEAEQVFAAAFPGKPYDNGALRHAMSYLLDVLRQYLAWAEWQADEGEQQRYLIRGLQRRNLDKLFKKEWQRAREKTEQTAIRDARHHYQRYQLYQEQLEQTARRERATGIDLQPLYGELTMFYVAEMLRHACAALSHQAIAGQEYRFDLLDNILEAIEREEMLHAPAIALYYHAYRMLKSAGAPEHFERLKSLLAEQEAAFSPGEMRGLYLLAINGCIRQMNTGQREYIREAYDLYKAALTRDFLKENGMISGFTYKNIIRIGVALGEAGWTVQFMEQYKIQLHPRERDNLYRYNLAYLYFQQQDYARAMPLLQQVELEDPLNNLDARRMLLRSYYELGEWAALDSLLQSFSAYLRRQKNLGYHRQTNEKLLYFTKKLMELRHRDSRGRAQLRFELDQTPDVAERAWLLSQM